MICEYCNIEHNGFYGSGRFCSKVCSRGYSTRAKREQINIAVSKKLTGKPASHNNGFKKGYDPRRKLEFRDGSYKHSEQCKKKISQTLKNTAINKIINTEFNNLTTGRKYRRVKLEQNYCCLHCGINSWLGKRIVIEIDHIDGNKKNNSRENLRGLCPNCHSQTDTWRKKKSALVDKLVKSPDLESGNFAGSTPAQSTRINARA